MRRALSSEFVASRYYLQNLLNHASPSITYRYIDENPVKKRTPEENQRSRSLLDQNGNGEKRIRLLQEALEDIGRSLNEPGKSDAFYGRVDCLLTEMEELTENFNRV